MTTVAEIQQVFIRVAQDSDFKMGPYDVAKFTASMLNISALQVWDAFGYLDTMTAVAKGDHPASKKVVDKSSESV